jgi:hypothetical protein
MKQLVLGMNRGQSRYKSGVATKGYGESVRRSGRRHVEQAGLFDFALVGSRHVPYPAQCDRELKALPLRSRCV